MTLQEIFIILATVFSGLVALRWLEQFIGPAMGNIDRAYATKEIERVRAEAKSEIDRVQQECEHRISIMKAECDARIDELQRRIISLTEMLQNAYRPRQTDPATVRSANNLTVLGIWPESNLDVHGERDAIRDAGLKYRPLFGEQATRSEILRELRTGKIGIIEIGAHGNSEELIINGQHLDAGWWQSTLTRYPVQMVVILACFSDQSIADAIKRAKIRHVIAVTGEIEDSAAVEFAEQFYALYAANMPVEQAFEEAMLVLDYRQAERIVLR